MSTDAIARGVAGRFAAGARVLSVEPFTLGHINASYVVVYERGGERQRALLQRINEAVFRDPDALMENVARVVRHLATAADPRARRGPHAQLVLLSAGDGDLVVRDADGGRWRAYRFIEGALTREAPATPAEAHIAARAFGEFQRRLADLPGPRLHETIPGFHDTPRRLAAFRDAVARDPAGRARATAAEIAAIEQCAALADALLAPHAHGEIAERVVHNDAKMANVLLDAATGEALCVVDLDTVMPGLALYDFGDMARSMASPAAEDERDLSRVEARPAFVEALVRGYLEGAAELLSPAERALLVTAAKVITYEQAVRFLADHVAGDVYYRIARPGQNLDRARTQLALLRSFEAQEDTFERLVAAAARSG